MCTVTYIAQPNGNFILTHNRDENASRSPQNLTRQERGSFSLIFPKDTGAGGTWIAASSDGRVVCVLNGAFEQHQRKPAYIRSRGAMALDFFNFPTAADFFASYDFDGMEPFTFIVAAHGKLFELRWDEKQTYLRHLDAVEGRYLWSSATLYPKDIQEIRHSWFHQWLEKRQDFSPEALHHFHQTGGKGDAWNGFLMNRNNLVQTLSITQVIKKHESLQLIYNDLLRDAVKKELLFAAT